MWDIPAKWLDCLETLKQANVTQEMCQCVWKTLKNSSHVDVSMKLNGFSCVSQKADSSDTRKKGEATREQEAHDFLQV